MPKTLISGSPKIIQNFRDENKDIIIKPLYGNGGEGIHRFDKSNFNFKKLITPQN